MRRRRGRSAASLVFVSLVVTMAVVALLTSGLLLLEGQRAGRAEAERVTQAVAQTLAHSPEVRSALTGDRAAAAGLQERAQEIMTEARVDFVTVMDADGIRLTHRNPEEIGRRYIGTIPSGATVLTEQFTGKKGLRGVRAEVKDGEIIVDVYLMVRYGYVIPETARKVQDSVSAAVSGMTGYSVQAVNVHVGGISFN